MNTKYLIQGSSPSGIALDFIDLEGNYQAGVLAGANADLDGDDLPEDEAFCGSIRLAIIQLECPISLIEAIGLKSKKYGIPILLNAAPAIPFPDSWWDWVEILVVNELEAETLAKKKIVYLEDARNSMGILLERCQNTVITLGEKGLLIGEGSQMKHIPAHTVSTVSTLGAGDAFVGVMAAELCQGADFENSAQIANYAAAASVTGSGAQTSYLTPEILLEHPVLGESFQQWHQMS